jgi:hypothetical protein
MKSSFILHLDSLCVLDKMSDEQAGRFIKAIYYYQKTKTLPELDLLLEMAITPFINQFFRDEKGYEKVIERNRENGKLGGRPKKEPKKPSGLKKTQNNPKNPSEPKKADSDSDSVNDSDSDSVKGSKKVFIPPTIEEVKEYFKEHGYSESSAIKAYGYYNAGNWKDSEGKQVKSWKQKMQGVWFKDENKTPVVQMNSLGATGTGGRNYDPNNPRNKW